MVKQQAIALSTGQHNEVFDKSGGSQLCGSAFRERRGPNGLGAKGVAKEGVKTPRVEEA